MLTVDHNLHNSKNKFIIIFLWLTAVDWLSKKAQDMLMNLYI